MDLKVFKHSADDILHEIYDSPYITEFKEGILPPEKFLFFKLQDILYLHEFSKGLYAIGDQTVEYRDLFRKWSKSCDSELDLLQIKFKTDLENTQQSPSNLLYTSYLMKILAEGQLCKSLSAFYPCHWIYYKVGRYLYKFSNEYKDNPYKEWVEFYYSEDFAKVVKEYKGILFKTLEKCNEKEFQECIEIFRNGCKMEYLFWDSAYHYQNWPLQTIKTKNRPTCVLTIAGSDSSGGAGIQADMNTFLAHQTQGTSVITAITSQNSCGVKDILAIPPEKVSSQLKCILEDYEVKAIKIGMIFEKEIAEAIYDILKDLKDTKIVLDPVMVATAGSNLMKEDFCEGIYYKLFGITTLVTPNIPEALHLLNHIPNNEINNITSLEDMKNSARKICQHFKLEAILIKGGHNEINNNSIDLLYDYKNDKEYFFQKEYLKSKNTHGTGCSLSSAITANLSKKYSLAAAVKCAKTYVFNAIKNGYHLGKGEYGTLCHFLKY